MKAELFWIRTNALGRLAIGPRPRGGDWLADEMRVWKEAGVEFVVSLLTGNEVAELGLADEEQLCDENGMQFLSFPIGDRSVPMSKASVQQLVAALATEIGKGRSIAIHCRQGIGRAPLIAICLLVQLGMQPAIAIQRVSEARGCAVPETAEQKRWLMEFAPAPIAA